MPHDGTPRNGRMHGFGAPGWVLALALAVAFAAAATVLALATGAFLILLPAAGILALGYGIYAAVSARRRVRYGDGPHVIRDGRALRRHSRFAGGAP